jgi:hypothetical protein
MTRRLLVAVASIGAAGSLVLGGVAGAVADTSAKVKDPKGDVKDCNTGAPAATEANDIRGVRVRSDGTVEVTMRKSVKRALKDFSFAVRVTITRPDGSTRTYLVQVHDGVETIGEVDPRTNQPLPDGDGAVDRRGKKVTVDTGERLPAGTAVAVEAFNLPEEGGAVSCDSASLQVS